MILPDNAAETRYVVGLAALWVWARQADAAGEIALGKQRSNDYHRKVKEAVQFGTRADGLVETAQVRALTFIDKNGEDDAITEYLIHLERLELARPFLREAESVPAQVVEKAEPKPIQVRQGVVVGSGIEPQDALGRAVKPKSVAAQETDTPTVVPPAPKPEPVKDDNKPNRTARQRVERNRG